MLFRKRGKKIYVIRTVYNKEKGRGEQVTVCKIEDALINVTTVNDVDIQDQLVASSATKEEIEEIAQWLEETQKGRKDDEARIKASGIDTLIKMATKRVQDENMSKHITEEMADEIFAEMKALRDALREAGYTEKRQRKTTKKDTK